MDAKSWDRWLGRSPRDRDRARRARASRRAAISPAWLEPLEERVVLSHFYTVTGLGDSTDAATHGGAGTSGSPFQMSTLRGAILKTNTDPGSTIVLPAGTYTLSISGDEDAAAAGDLDVTSAVTIQGAGSGSTIVQAGTTTSNGVDKIFSFNPLGNSAGFAVSLSGLTLRNGRNLSTYASGNNAGGAFDFDGGTNFAGSLTMNDVIVSNNQTTHGGIGGGIALFDGGTVTITNSQIINNTASTTTTQGLQGGGIFIGSSNTGTVTITNTTISGNKITNPGGAIGASAFDGGGIYATFGGSLILHGDTITNNTALGSGGGVSFDHTGTLTIDQGTVLSGNTAGASGGAVKSTATTTITGAVLASNSAVNGGGAIYASGSSSITVRNSRIVGNSSTSGGSVAERNIGLNPTVDLANNWFGTNSPAASLFGSGVTSSPFLVMAFSSSKTTLNPGDTSTLTASITTNSNGQTGFSVPDGSTTATFAATHGTVNPTNATLVSGSASSTYTPTAGYSGAASVSATIDNQTLTIAETINAAPVVTTNPTSQTVNAGQSVSFTAAATGTPTPTVQWQVSTNGGASFANVSGATSTTFTFTASASQNNNQYRAVFTNAAGSATTSAATLTVNSAPNITTNPTSQTVNAGQTATFTAAASGTPTPTVQWQVSTDGGSSFSNVSGATSTTYSFTASAGQNGNLFRAVFTNSVGSATTTAATLTVISAPTANNQSVNVAFNTATPVTLTGGDPNSPPRSLTYIVTASPAHGTLSGTAPNLTYTPNAGYHGADSFTFKTNNGALDSNVATVSITVATGTPTANGQSVNVAHNSAGTAVTLTASDPDSPPLALTYAIATTPAHGTLSGFNATTGAVTYTPSAGYHGADSFTFTASNGTNTSAAATVSLTVAVGTPTANGQSTNANQNTPLAITLTGSDDDSPPLALTYAIATNPAHGSLSNFNATAGTVTYTPTAGYFGPDSFTFTASNGTNTSSAATVSITVRLVQAVPTITGDPASQTVNAGQTATFSASASGTPTPTVQWQVSTDGGSSFSDIAGANSTTLSFTTNAGQDGNKYRAVFTNAAGSATTTAATLTVNSAPAVTTNPTSQTVNAGQSVSFTAAATGKPSPTVQWQVSTDGGSTFANVAGATSATFTFTASAGQGGNQYRAIFTNSVGSATTTAATLTVNSAPVVATNPASQTVNAGQTATFSASASGSPTPTVQWQVSTDGGASFTNVSGATSTTLSFTASAGQSGNQYRAVFTNAAGSATTTAATLTVNTAPVVATNPTSQSVVTGQTATFTAAATGSPSPTVRWQVSTNGGSTFSDIPGATSTTLSFAANAGQNGYEYRAVFTNAAGSATTTAATLTVQQATIGATSVSWGTAGTAALQTAADGLRLLAQGRNIDLPWLGINRLTITLNAPETLSASDVSATGIAVADYGPVTVTPNYPAGVTSGPAASWTITLAKPINAADRVTVTIGNADVATFTRRLDVLPGDVNDDGIVNSQDGTMIRNAYSGIAVAVPAQFLDVNGDGVVDSNDFNIARQKIGTHLP